MLELFWLECKSGQKSGFETSLEQRMKKFGVCGRESLRRATLIPETKPKLVIYLLKCYEAILKEYDTKKALDLSYVQDIKFYIDFAAPVSIEILLQKHFSDNLNTNNQDNEEDADDKSSPNPTIFTTYQYQRELDVALSY